MSKVSWKGPLILAIILFVVSSAVYWLEFSYRPEKEEAEEKEKKPFVLDDRSIKSIRIQSGAGKNGSSFLFECQDVDKDLCKPGDNSRWKVIEPRKLSADDSNVNSLVSTLNNLTASERIDLKDESEEKKKDLLKQYGLSESKRTGSDAHRIEITFADGKTLTGYFGDKHPISGGRFTATAKGSDLNKNRVFVSPTHIETTFERNLTYWRDKKLFSVSTNQIKGFHLDGTKSDLQATKEDGKWILDPAGKEKDLPGDIENVDSLLTSATYLTAKDIPFEDKTSSGARTALRKAKKVLSLELRLVKEKTGPVHLSLYKEGDGTSAKVFATVSNLDPVYLLDSAAITQLDKSVKDLRLNKLITSMDRFSTQKIEIESAATNSEGTYSLKQENGEWKVARGTIEAFDPGKVQELLDKLASTRIRDFVSGAEAKASKEGHLIFVLYGEDEESPTRKLQFWRSKGKLYGKDLNSGRNEAFLLEASLADALPWKKEHFKKSASPDKPDQEVQHPETEGHGHGYDHEH